EKTASLLYVEVPDVAPIDDKLHRPLFIVTEWAREEALVCEQNARKRVPLVSPAMCDIRALKVDMVIYPPGSAAPECRHEGAGTFMYFLTGRGSGTANGKPYSVSGGELIHFADREKHTLQAAGDELRFIEVHVPAEFKTVWTDPKKVSVWRSTGLDVSGLET